MVGAFLRFGAGVAMWTVAEYVTHRFPMHAARGSSPLADEHLDHHGHPLDARPLKPDLHNLTYKGVALAAVSKLASPAAGVGFTLGYAGYTHLHHRIHHRAPKSELAKKLWRHHHAHHFASPAGNYGVTTRGWDRVLGTLGAGPPEVAVAARHAPQWMAGEPGYRVVGGRTQPIVT